MKWKLYQMANLLNIISVVAFSFFIIYNLSTRLSEPDIDIVACFFAAAAVCLWKGFVAINYQRRIDHGELYITNTRWLFIVLAVVQLVCAIFLTYGLYQLMKGFREASANWTVYFGIADFLVFTVSAFFVNALDLSLLKRLRLLEDPSTGILDHLSSEEDVSRSPHP